MIYAGTGVAGLVLGQNFLDYSVLSHDSAHGHELGIFLVEARRVGHGGGRPCSPSSMPSRAGPLMPISDGVAAHYNQWITVFLMVAGLYVVIARGNMVKKLVGLSIFQTSVYLLYISPGKISAAPRRSSIRRFTVYSNPLPHVLILTAIVVGVATLALGLALVVRINEAYGTIEEDEIFEQDAHDAECSLTAACPSCRWSCRLFGALLAALHPPRAARRWLIAAAASLDLAGHCRRFCCGRCWPTGADLLSPRRLGPVARHRIPHRRAQRPDPGPGLRRSARRDHAVRAPLSVAAEIDARPGRLVLHHVSAVARGPARHHDHRRRLQRFRLSRDLVAVELRADRARPRSARARRRVSST